MCLQNLSWHTPLHFEEFVFCLVWFGLGFLLVKSKKNENFVVVVHRLCSTCEMWHL